VSDPAAQRDKAERAVRGRQTATMRVLRADLRRIANLADEEVRAAEASVFAQQLKVLVEEAVAVRRTAIEALLAAGRSKQDAATLTGLSASMLTRFGPPKPIRRRAG